MRQLKNLLNRIPRPAKAVFFAICAAILAIVYYIALSCPTLFFRQEFRRAEKVHMVGPSRIVQQLNGEYDEFDKMIVGETEHGICFFGRYYNSYPYRDPLAEKQYLFAYVEKTADMTVAAAPNVWGTMWEHIWEHIGIDRALPVYLFTEDQNAVQAQITITATEIGSEEQEGKTHSFQAEATRSEKGFFRFWLRADEEGSLAALAELSNITANYRSSNSDLLDISATVRLYDADGKLVQEKEWTLQK